MSKLRTSAARSRQLFHPNFRRTSFLLVFMWITVAMSYYGLILINTSLMTLDKEDEHHNQNSTRCKPLSSDDYKSLMLTTVGRNVRHSSISLSTHLCWSLSNLFSQFFLGFSLLRRLSLRPTSSISTDQRDHLSSLECSSIRNSV